MKDSRTGTTSIVNIALPSERILAWTKSNPGITSVLTKKKEEEKPQEGKADEEKFTKEELKELEKEVEFIQEEDIGQGLAGALKKLREKGYMEPTAFEKSGRTKDVTVEQELSKWKSNAGKNIKLEYRDDKGRLMTPKEAFRYQCWAFHGKRPGANKMRKRLQKELQAKKAMSVAPDQTATMRTLQRIQKETNQPYAVLNLPKNQ